MFFEAENGSFYPLSAVTQVRKYHQENAVSVDLRDGSVRVNLRYWERLVERKPLQLTTAQPSTYVLDPIDGGEFYEKVGVVAWAVLSNGEVAPVTADGIDERTRPILMPDGQVIEPEVMTHDDLEKFLTYRKSKIWVQGD